MSQQYFQKDKPGWFIFPDGFGTLGSLDKIDCQHCSIIIEQVTVLLGAASHVAQILA